MFNTRHRTRKSALIIVLLVLGAIICAVPVSADQFADIPGFKYSYDPASHSAAPISPATPITPMTPSSEGILPGGTNTPGTFAFDLGFGMSNPGSTPISSGWMTFGSSSFQPAPGGESILSPGINQNPDPLNIIPQTQVSPEILDLVQEIQSDNYYTRQDASEALIAIGPSAIEPLIPLMGHTNYYIRHLAADTLERLGYVPRTPREKAYFIVAQHEYNPDINKEAFQQLRDLGAVAAEPLMLVLKDPNYAMLGSNDDDIEVLVAIGEPAVPSLIQALGDRLSREAAGIALWEIGNPTGRAAVMQLLDRNGISPQYYASNFKEIMSGYDFYNRDRLDLLGMITGLALYGNKDMAEYMLNSQSILHDPATNWAHDHGYTISYYRVTR